MCGIAGFHNYNNQVVLRGMTDALTHRGPDDFGCTVFPVASLGHRRLSIIDLSTSGHQPMCDDSGKVWITYNGEVYNFLQEKQLLQKKGCQFRSQTDTEVILYLYKEYGVDCLKHLKGMFAFAIWDERNQQLFLARDHLGVKPLYYWRNKTSLFFASEIKALLKVPEYHANVNVEFLPHYLSMQYVPGPATLFEGIMKLEAGHYLVARDSQVRIEKYWDVRVTPEKEKTMKSVEEAEERLKGYLKESVRSQMISDVPIGAFLSGGVDSSMIVAMMSQCSTQPIKTFSVGFDVGRRYDERRFSDMVSRRFNCDHHSIVLRPNIVDLIPKIVYHMDEPIADPAMIPTYLLAEFARREVTVVLTGEGADELFGGYKQYRLDKLHALYSLLPQSLRSISRDFIIRTVNDRRVENALDTLALNDTIDRRLSWTSIATFPVVDEVLSTDLAARRNNHSKNLIRNNGFADNALDEWLKFDIKYWLADDLLMKVDKTAMAWSLEARVPYLDQELVEFCFALPARLKVTLLQSKRILKSVAADFLSPVIYKRQKHGFNLPLSEWFRHELVDLMRDTISDLHRSHLFNAVVIERLFTEHKERHKDHSRLLFALLVFSQWYRHFIEKKA